ncbi:MAG: small subunit ribosomal protein S5 [Alphaproteobacteria bacterium]|jgi:small subunit ribosomal protein S5
MTDDRNKDELYEKLVFINRVSKTVKGGRTLSFAALVIVGDRKGRIGFGHGKAKEVPDAIRKASERARSSLVRIPLRDGKTLHHNSTGRWGAGNVLLKTSKTGRGIIAGAALRPIFDLLGVQDIVAKSLGSSNPFNLVRACFDGLQKQTSPRYIALKRDKKISEIVSNRAA